MYNSKMEGLFAMNLYELKRPEEKEPPYIKIYLDNLHDFQNIQLNPVLKSILKRATPAEKGQVIYTNLKTKQEIAEECSVSINWIQAEIARFVKKGILVKLSHTVYLLNPFLFGNGSWHDVSEIRKDKNYFPEK